MAIGAKSYLENEIMSAGGNPALEAQCYIGGTLLHDQLKRWFVRPLQRDSR
jgi:hypothetical protein